MYVKKYEELFKQLKEYNAQVTENYGNEIYQTPPQIGDDLTNIFPITIFQEARNVSNTRFMAGREIVASVGYRVDIFATTKGQILHQTIARDIMQYIDDFMSCKNLTRSSYNTEYNDDIYHIILVYSGNLYENRAILI